MDISLRIIENSIFITSEEDTYAMLEPLGFDFNLSKAKVVEVKVYPNNLIPDVDIQFQNGTLYIHIPFPFDKVDILHEGVIVDSL